MNQTNDENDAATKKEATSIALYEYWYRNSDQISSMLSSIPNQATSKSSFTPQQSSLAVVEHWYAQQQLQLQYQAMLHEFQITNMIDPINMMVLQQQQQQQQIDCPHDTIPIQQPPPTTFSTTNNCSTQPRHISMAQPPPRHNPDINQWVDDFFHNYPNGGRRPNNDNVREGTRTTKDIVARRHSNIHHAEYIESSKNHDDTMMEDNNDDNDLCVIVEPKRNVTVMDEYPQPRTKKNRNATTVPKNNDDPPSKQCSMDCENDSYHGNRKSKRPPNPDSRNIHNSYTNNMDDSDNDHRGRRTTKRRPPATTTSTTTVNPFQTAREVAQTHVFGDSDDDTNINVPQPPLHNCPSNNTNEAVPVDRPVSNTHRPQQPSNIHVANNPYQPPPPPPPLVIRESLKRKFQPPMKRTETTEKEESSTASRTTGATSQPAHGRRSKKSSSGPIAGAAATAPVATAAPSSHPIVRKASACTTTATNNNKSNNQNNVKNNDDDDDELPEELRIYGKDLVEKIENEIMDDNSQSTTPITFDDIAGLKDQKQTVYEVVCWPMQRPDLFTGLRRAPNGLLLYGPPGTGTYFNSYLGMSIVGI